MWSWDITVLTALFSCLTSPSLCLYNMVRERHFYLFNFNPSFRVTFQLNIHWSTWSLVLPGSHVCYRSHANEPFYSALKMCPQRTPGATSCSLCAGFPCVSSIWILLSVCMVFCNCLLTLWPWSQGPFKQLFIFLSLTTSRIPRLGCVTDKYLVKGKFLKRRGLVVLWSILLVGCLLPVFSQRDFKSCLPLKVWGSR